VTEVTSTFSKLLSERRFWNVISRSLDGTDSVGLRMETQEQSIERELERLSRDEHTGFLGHLYSRFHKSYRNDLWAVAFTVMKGCSEDCFIDFRMWFVMRGRSVYNAGLRNPDFLCPEFDKIPEDDIPLWDYGFSEHFDRRFGDGAHSIAYAKFKFPPEKLADPENKWTSDDESTIRKLCPIVFEKYWENTRF